MDFCERVKQGIYRVQGRGLKKGIRIEEKKVALTGAGYYLIR